MFTKLSPNDLKLVSCRPSGRNAQLAGIIKGLGGELLEVPLLGIRFNTIDLDDFDGFHAVVFVSVNAVLALQANLTQALSVALSGVLTLAVGQATADALEEAGVSVDHCANLQAFKGAASEALIAQLEPLHWQGQRVVICRGQQGRQVLADWFNHAGALLSEVACYERSIIEDPLHGEKQRLMDQSNVVLLTSEQIIDAYALLHNNNRQWQHAVLTISERLQQHAKNRLPHLPHNEIIRVASLSAEELRSVFRVS